LEELVLLEKIKQHLVFKITIIRLYKEIFKGNGVKLILLQKIKKTKEIVFVGGKTRQLNYDYSLNPEEALTSKNVRRLKRAFLSYLSQYNLEDNPWRFDFIAIEIDNFSKKPIIRHYEDIFLEFKIEFTL